MKAVEALIIHLARAEKRRPQVEKLLTELQMPAGIIDAVDGNALSREEIAAVYRRDLHQPRYPFVLRPAEIGCFLSHRKAWQTILDRNLDAGLIVEDDVAVADRFPDLIHEVSRVIEPKDYIRFPRWVRGEAGKTIRRSGEVSIVDPFLPGLGMQVELVGCEAARMLLAATETFDRPVDSIVQMQWLHGARVLSARPILIREIDRELGGTVLQKKRQGLAEWLYHELNRPFLRLAVKLRNRKWRKEERCLRPRSG